MFRHQIKCLLSKGVLVTIGCHSAENTGVSIMVPSLQNFSSEAH